MANVLPFIWKMFTRRRDRIIKLNWTDIYIWIMSVFRAQHLCEKLIIYLPHSSINCFIFNLFILNKLNKNGLKIMTTTNSMHSPLHLKDSTLFSTSHSFLTHSNFFIQFVLKCFSYSCPYFPIQFPSQWPPHFWLFHLKTMENVILRQNNILNDSNLWPLFPSL